MLKRLCNAIRGWCSRKRADAASGGPGDSGSDAAVDELRAEHDRVRTEAHREVGEVLTCTEEATMSVCANLDRVVTDAQSFIGDIKTRLSDLEGDSAGGGVSETLDGRCALVTSFLDELREMVQLQMSDPD